MRIIDVLHKNAILMDLKSTDKKSILEELVTPVAQISGINQEILVRVLLEREKLGSTGIGDGVGIPHGKLKSLKSLILGLGISHKGIDFDSIDGRPTHIFFLLLTPENSTDIHLKLLARICKMLKNNLLKERLLNTSDVDIVYSIINDEDENF